MSSSSGCQRGGDPVEARGVPVVEVHVTLDEDELRRALSAEALHVHLMGDSTSSEGHAATAIEIRVSGVSDVALPG
jgi:hypothetical protein